MFNTFFLLHRLFTGFSAKKCLKIFPHREDRSEKIAIIEICVYVLRFSKESCFTFPFYCTALCAEFFTKEGFNHLLQRA